MPRSYTPELRAADVLRLNGVHPSLVLIVMRVLDTMATYGFPMFVTHGVRTVEKQQALYAQGRTTPGKVVTNADGVTSLSYHQLWSDGWGHAVDCAFLDDPDTLKIETYDDAQPWEVYGVLAEHLGARWGGRFKSLQDRPHLELPPGVKPLLRDTPPVPLRV